MQTPLPYWHYIQASLAALGGFAGIVRIIEWIRSGPKLWGEIEVRITGTWHNEANQPIGASLFLLVYVVNKRLEPVTIRGFEIWAKSRGKWKKGVHATIPEGLRLPECPIIDFSSSRLYDKAADSRLEYGKGMNGWLLATFENETRDEIQTSSCRVVLIDAFGRKHVIEAKTEERRAVAEVPYFPGDGIKQRAFQPTSQAPSPEANPSAIGVPGITKKL